jgi:hypothetical protein
VSENKELRKIFRNKMDEVSEQFRILHNGNLGGCDRFGMWLGWERQGMHTEF